MRLNRYLPLPGSSRNYEVLFYLLVLAYITILGYQARTFGPLDLLFPVFVGVPVFILLVVHLVFLQFPGIEDAVMPDIDEESEFKEIEEKLRKAAEGTSARTPGETQKYEILMVVWTIALPVLAYLFGFITVFPIYVFSFIWYFTRDLKKSIIVTLLFSIFAYSFFILLLEMNPWRGILPPYPTDYI